MYSSYIYHYMLLNPLCSTYNVHSSGKIRGLLSAVDIPVWVLKLRPKFKETDAKQHQLLIFNANVLTLSQTFDLNDAPTNVKIKTCVCYCSLFQNTTVYRLYKQIEHFCSTNVPKLTPEYGTE